MSSSAHRTSSTARVPADGHGDLRWRQLTLAICAIGREEGVDARLARVLSESCRILRADQAVLVLDEAEHVEQVITSGGTPEAAAAARERLETFGLTLPRPSRVGVQTPDEPLPAVATPAPDAPWIAAPVFTESARFGVLYVLDPQGRVSFSAEDRRMLTCLADTTGTGLDCAVASHEARQHSAWLHASSAIAEQLVTLKDGVVVVAQHIADQLRATVAADVVTVELPDLDDPGLLQTRVAAAEEPHDLVDQTVPRAQSLAAPVLDAGTSRREVGTPDRGPLLAVPFDDPDQGQVGAVLIRRRPGAGPFTLAEQVIAEDFTRHLTIALALAERRTLEEQLQRQRERDDLAERLQENVTQHLYSLGLQLQMIKGAAPADAALTGRLDRAIAELDDAIRHVRTSLWEA